MNRVSKVLLFLLVVLAFMLSLSACHRHSYQEVFRVNPSCLDDGYVTYECPGCLDTYDEVLPAGGFPLFY